MRVFVTGASGHIASAVIPELLANDHEVVGLARSDVSAETVAALGAEVHRGDLDDLDGLKAAAGSHVGIAFAQEFAVGCDPPASVNAIGLDLHDGCLGIAYLFAAGGDENVLRVVDSLQNVDEVMLQGRIHSGPLSRRKIL